MNIEYFALQRPLTNRPDGLQFPPKPSLTTETPSHPEDRFGDSPFLCTSLVKDSRRSEGSRGLKEKRLEYFVREQPSARRQTNILGGDLQQSQLREF